MKEIEIVLLTVGIIMALEGLSFMVFQESLKRSLKQIMKKRNLLRKLGILETIFALILIIIVVFFI